MNKRYALPAVALSLLLALSPAFALAHSGRTDSSGGHKDNKNKSGLGSYHYHCGGNPPHLHTGGVCPYAKKSSTSASGGGSAQKSTSSNRSASAAAASDADEVMDSFIREAVQAGVVTPSLDPETLAERVDVLLAYASKTVNVREEPDSESKKLGFVPQNEKILVLQPHYTDTWHQVYFDGQIGYVSAKLCRLTDIVTRTIDLE